MKDVVIITFKAPRYMVEILDRLVEMRVFSSRSEAIREGIRMVIERYRHMLETSIPRASDRERYGIRVESLRSEQE